MIKHCPDCQSERLSINGSDQKTEGDDNGLAGDATEAAAPAQRDDRIDDPVFDDYHCLDCGYEFSCRRSGWKQRLESQAHNCNQSLSQ
jgi:hypothetical protein